MPEILGLEFAPANIPLERRLQTFAVLYWSSCFLFMGVGGTALCVIVFFYTSWYWLVMLYMVWYWFDYLQGERGGRRSTWCRNWKIWDHMRDYFPATLVKTAELDPNKNYVCGYHPHGIFCAGAMVSFCTEALGFSKKFPRITPSLLTLQLNFKFPLYREFILSLGACSVSAQSINWLLKNQGKGNMVVIVIGGATEALDAHPGQVKLTLKRRRGFVRLALTHGASLLPVFAFGENELYAQVSNPQGSLLRKIQTVLTKFIGVSPPVFHGRGIFQYNFGYLPFRKPISIVVGKPIDVELIAKPTREQIDHYHTLYIDALTKLFDEHKVYYDNYRQVTLEIV